MENDAEAVVKTASGAWRPMVVGSGSAMREGGDGARAHGDKGNDYGSASLEQ